MAGETKVSLMTYLDTVPDDAKLYVVKPGDTTPYYTTKAALLDGISGGTTPALDQVLGESGISDKTITLKNTANDKRKLIFNPNTVNGPAMQIWDDDGAGNSVLHADFTSYALQMLGSIFGGMDLYFDPFVGLSFGIGSDIIIVSNTGITVNGEAFYFPTTPGGSTIATEQFVNALIEGIKKKDPVRVATTANITLSGTQTIDGIAVFAGDRVLVKNQTTQTQNGIYVCQAGGWNRTDDANTATELTSAITSVLEGTANAEATFRQLTTSITLGTSNIVWDSFGVEVPDADSSTKGKMKLYTLTGTNTDGTITQGLFKTEIDTLTANVNGRKQKESLLSMGTPTITAVVGQDYIAPGTTNTINDPSPLSTGSSYVIWAIAATLTIGGVSAYYDSARIFRYYNGVSWVSYVYEVADNFQPKSDYMKLTSAYTLASSTSLQKLFNVGYGSGGAYNAAANRTIRFECEFFLTGLSSTSGNLSFGILGTAGISGINYFAIGSKNTALSVVAASSTSSQVATATEITVSNSGTTARIIIHGTIVTSTAGTIILAVATGVATGACQVGVNSFAQFEDIGADTLGATSNIT